MFLGEFAMCHRLDLDARLDVEHTALPAADLLLMKLQVVHLNLKDVQDLAALLTTHELGDGDGEGVIDRGRLRDVLGADWGFYTTAGDNLERLGDLVAGHAPAAEPRVREQSAALRERARGGAEDPGLPDAREGRAAQALVRAAGGVALIDRLPGSRRTPVGCAVPPNVNGGWVGGGS